MNKQKEEQLINLLKQLKTLLNEIEMDKFLNNMEFTEDDKSNGEV